MTAMSSGYQRLVELSRDEFRARLREALNLYVAAMNYPPETADQRMPMWLTHALREGWRCVGALDADGALVGLAYGYRGSQGQWWHEQVRRGLTGEDGEQAAQRWLSDYFELTEIHVRPDRQGKGTGEDLLRGLVEDVSQENVLLSTPEGTSRAWKLYRRLGFVDVLRDYCFAGDPRPFAILGRSLPLDQRD
ncbi:acetyltransferase [Prauserella marina]|uniref:Acetyltransferase (GNAT) family protein n=1 Tax=Prauserella marina TaxID=530584 RepID=A0A222VUB9_9PSEU|nr:GNAT family N-acetyltransferase [Prauserella marina]ASR37527.1 acetyltransferase [Prauserella marina]PWV75422.1 acetyltransferase (GNAT) family protein [Prauserella marina]SDD34925.1 Acetyltransferase (GNAT) family protein [Prauserella marina]